MKILARKCPYTGKLFDITDRDSYIQHLAALKETRRNKSAKTTAEIFIDLRKTLCSVDDIPSWFIKNKKFLLNHLKNDPTILPSLKNIIDTINLESMDRVKQTYTDTIFHDLPIMENYGLTKTDPDSESFKGHYLRLSFSNDSFIKSSIIESLLMMSGFHIYDREVTRNEVIFSAYVLFNDWPGLEQEHVARLLRGK